MDYSKFIIKGEKKSKRTVLLKGASGTGKTHQFRTLHESGLRGMYVDVEAKISTIRDLEPDIWLVRNVDFPLTPAEKTQLLSAGQSDLMALFDFIRYEKHDYDFIYFDSLMRYASKLVDYLQYEKKLTGYDLWGAFAKKMRKAMEMLVSLSSAEFERPVHVIGTWGVEIGVDWQGKRAIQPIVDGKVVGPQVDYFFDDVLYLAKREDATSGVLEFIAYTGGTQEFSAKVSKAPDTKLPAVISAPDLSKILTLLTVTKEDKQKEAK